MHCFDHLTFFQASYYLQQSFRTLVSFSWNILLFCVFSYFLCFPPYFFVFSLFSLYLVKNSLRKTFFWKEAVKSRYRGSRSKFLASPHFFYRNFCQKYFDVRGPLSGILGPFFRKNIFEIRTTWEKLPWVLICSPWYYSSVKFDWNRQHILLFTVLFKNSDSHLFCPSTVSVWHSIKKLLVMYRHSEEYKI